MWLRLNNIIDGLICTIIGSLLMMLWQNRTNFFLVVKSFCRFYNKDIRFSISYLYRIKIDEKYLLIKGNRIEQLQPVGGVFKYYPSFKDKFEKWGIKNESKERFYATDDLRIIVKGRYARQIIKWFNSGENREITACREFYEEIIEPGYLPENSLNVAEVEYLKQIPPKIGYSEHFKMHEILLFNIYELKLCKEDKKRIIDKINEGDSRLYLVDRERINCECIQICGKDYKIGKHSKYIL